MRDIRLRDGSVWHLHTIHDLGNGATPRRRESSTYVWVACTQGDVEIRLMFAATWVLWPDEVLVAALEREIARIAVTVSGVPTR